MNQIVSNDHDYIHKDIKQGEVMTSDRVCGWGGASHQPSKPAFRHTPVSLSQIWPINSAPPPCEWQDHSSWTMCLYRGIEVERSAGSSGPGQLGCVQRPKPSLALRAVLSLPSTGEAQQPQTQGCVWGLVSGATGQ